MLMRLSAARASVIAGGVIFVIAVTLEIMKLISPPSLKSQRHVTLVYVGAENCAPCDIWQRNQGTAFRDTAEFHRLTYREVKSPSLLDVLKDDNWPEDLRAYRQTIGQHAGVPLWREPMAEHDPAKNKISSALNGNSPAIMPNRLTDAVSGGCR